MTEFRIGVTLLAAVASFLFGWLWYSPIMFQKQWMKMSGIPNVQPGKKTMARTMVLGLLTYIVLAGVMDYLFQIIGVGTLSVALKIAAIMWLGFVATLGVGMVTWEGKPWKLYFINVGYQLLSFLIIATILFQIS